MVFYFSTDLVKGNPTWIGIRDPTGSNSKWTDGTPLTYSNWSSGQPNESMHCGAVSVAINISSINL